MSKHLLIDIVYVIEFIINRKTPKDQQQLTLCTGTVCANFPAGLYHVCGQVSLLKDLCKTQVTLCNATAFPEPAGSQITSI